MEKSTFTLVDSIAKKARAVSDIVQGLGLQGLNVVCGRAEDLSGKKQFQRTFDVVVSRGVAPLRRLVPWARPFLREGRSVAESPVLHPGTLLAFKGGDVEKEAVEARARFKLTDVRVVPLVFQGSENLSLVDKKLILVRF